MIIDKSNEFIISMNVLYVCMYILMFIFYMFICLYFYWFAIKMLYLYFKNEEETDILHMSFMISIYY